VTRAAIALSVALLASPGCDPVHSDAVAALGPEAPDVHTGPTHRPGQPCLVCHDGGFGDPPRFTLAGTVYETPDAKVGVNGAMVTLVETDGYTTQWTTNEAGNFYVTPDQYQPTFPLQATIQAPGGPAVHMQTLIGGNSTLAPNGACSSCHFDPVGPNSPGHLSLALDDGGTPP